MRTSGTSTFQAKIFGSPKREKDHAAGTPGLLSSLTVSVFWTNLADSPKRASKASCTTRSQAATMACSTSKRWSQDRTTGLLFYGSERWEPAHWIQEFRPQTT